MARIVHFPTVAAALGILALWGCRAAAPATVTLNDNRAPAGKTVGHVLTLDLDVTRGLWHPEGPTGVGIVVPVFAEHGREPQAPGPLVRVTAGARISLRVHNLLPSSTVTVHGFHDRPGGTGTTITLAPQTAQDVTFKAGPAGTYFYWATTSGLALDKRDGYDAQLTGALIVDPPGTDVRQPGDRVFVIGGWSAGGDPVPDAALKDKETWAINGASWPSTEHLSYPVGQPIRWRVINASYQGHPMHLHGTYFHVERVGTEDDTTALSPADQPMAVTDVIKPGQTIDLTWTPGQPGRWLFHCHILFHVDPLLRITPDQSATNHAEHTGEQHMAGLVLSVDVQPAAGLAAVDLPDHPRLLTVTVGERAGVQFPVPDEPGVRWPGLGYRLDDGHPSRSDAPFASPGPPIILTRGEPVAITVRNELTSTTTVHWHGIELESYYDGVSGIGGLGSRITPTIPAGGSFVARFTPPRAGTFMYHTHLNDYEQLSTGLYGALIVLPPGAHYDPAVDHAFVISRGGPDDELAPVLINGAEHGTLELHRGVAQRFRFMAITPAPHVIMSVRDGGDRLLTWQPLAKDGADFASARSAAPASQDIYPGETYDFAWTPAAAGAFELRAQLGQKIRSSVTLHVK